MDLVTPCGRHTSNKGKPFTVESIGTHISQCRACQSKLEADIADTQDDRGVDEVHGDLLFEGVRFTADDFDLLAYFAQ